MVIEELDRQLLDLRQAQAHEAAADAAELRMDTEMVVIKTKQFEIAKGLTELSMQSIQVGQQTHLDLVASQEKLLNSESGLDQAKIDLWEKLADIAEKAGIDLLELAGMANQNNQPNPIPAQPDP